MTPEIKDMTNWADAERWLAKRGFGLGQIQEQRELWDAAQKKKLAVTPEPVATPKPAVKTRPKPVAAPTTNKK